jgi:cysteinyl-tRNA synthetase
MSAKYLGPHYDIHCGGSDLIFPHHENEIAQSEAAWGAPFARFWLHNGMVTVDAEKMSKSLGNFVTVADVLARNDAEGLRYFLLGTHYRGPLAFDVEKLDDGRVVFPGVDEAERRVDYLFTTRETLLAAAGGASPGQVVGLAPQAKVVAEARAKVLEALDKDLNTSQALSVLGELARAGNEIAMQIPRLKKDPKALAGAQSLARKAADAITAACAPLGLLQASHADYAARTTARRLKVRGLTAEAVQAKVDERTAARAAKDFALADAVRGELTTMGVEVFDSPSGSTWKLAV